MKTIVNIFWFRRDLRLHDNAGLYYALKDKNPVLPIFIFDTNILNDLEDKSDRRVQFIYQVLEELHTSLKKLGSGLDIKHGDPYTVFKELLEQYNIQKVFTNNDYEPYATGRDGHIRKLLKSSGVNFCSYKDQVIFEKDEIVKDEGSPYTIFTPYSRKWKSSLNHFFLKNYPTSKYFKNFFALREKKMPSLNSIGFQATPFSFPSEFWDNEKIRNYKEKRDIPSLKGTTRLSLHLRFGTISIRELARKAGPLNESFLNELIWRDFYQMILWHFPRVVQQSFKPAYDNIKWRNNEKEFSAWCTGQTGYPIVDAGMRELNETGFMHNRVRMIVASFLTKHLLIDWRWGEAYFAKKLLDYDLAANNGGWQWAAGSGCDAAPYFRIFNPYLQTKKFDPELKYIKSRVRDFDEISYPLPIVNHELARKRCLDAYMLALKK